MINKHYTLAGFCLLFIWTFMSAQNTPCGCDFILDASLAKGISFAPWRTGAYYLNPKPGQTICLKGNYADLRIDGISGTAEKPIIIKNMCNIVATFNSTTNNPPFSLSNAQFVKISGADTPQRDTLSYGITIDCAGSAGISVSGTTTHDIEIEHVEVKKSGFAGFMIKQDPTCDPKTWRDSMTMNNINVHHNYIHDVTGEGLYIGNTFWTNGMTRTCNGQTQVVYPHRILGLKVHHNIIRNTGWDGLQYGCAPDADVHDNLIENTGLLNAVQQMNGVQIGAGSGGLFYKNTIRNAGGTGVALIGFSKTTKIYNNLIINASEGIFADSRDSIKAPKIELNIYNNTLINVVNKGITIYDNGHQYKNDANQWVFFPKGYQPRVKNNVIIGAYFDVHLILRDPSVRLDSSHNFKLRTPFSSPPQYFATQKLALFADTISYQLKANSYLINKGTNSVLGVLSDDILGVSRLSDDAFDIGAYEYASVGVSSGKITALVTAKSVNNYRLAPSVANDELTVYLPEVAHDTEIKVINLNGQVILSQPIAEIYEEQRIHLSVTNIPQGYYLCVVVSSNKVVSSMKFTKV